MERTSLENILKLNKHAVSETGELKNLAIQYAQYAYAKEYLDERAASEYMPLIVSVDSGMYGIPELSGKPLVLFNHAIRHIQKKHGARIEDITELAGELESNLLVYQDPYKPNSYIFVLRLLDDTGNRFIAALNANLRHNNIEINSVASIHDKEKLFKHINDAIARNKKIYVNERTGDWLNDSREWELDASTEISLAKVVVHNHLRELLYQTKNGINLDNPQEDESRSSQESLEPLLFSIDLPEGYSWSLKKSEGGSHLKAELLDDGGKLVLTHDPNNDEVICTTPGAFGETQWLKGNLEDPYVLIEDIVKAHVDAKVGMDGLSPLEQAMAEAEEIEQAKRMMLEAEFNVSMSEKAGKTTADRGAAETTLIATPMPRNKQAVSTPARDQLDSSANAAARKQVQAKNQGGRSL